MLFRGAILPECQAVAGSHIRFKNKRGGENEKNNKYPAIFDQKIQHEFYPDYYFVHDPKSLSRNIILEI